ncbi:MAG: DNA mismatch repair endonuclease MutL, partial [Thermodesulfobacteriota bacterium]|nr:DNA mismatch repair endonuclease MutL [Thermodesulfobacteriota bacterium]
FSIKTLGFRGEAIPSISAVSKMEITSRPLDQLAANRLKIAGGQLKSIDETGSPAGTIVEVRDLFYNVPARRKFLRAAKTETDHIIDNMSRIALPFIRIHFRLDDSQKTILNLPVSENELNRLSILMGRNVAGSMIDACQDKGDLALRAYLASPDLSRNRGDRIFVYINGRNIRDRLITRAVMEGYGQRLMKGRYPQIVVFLEINPLHVDVNVHPTKQEVRFHRGDLVYQAITSTIEKSLRSQFHSVFDTGYSRSEGAKEAKINGWPMAEPEWEYSGGSQKETVNRATGLQEVSFMKEGHQIIGQLRDTYILCQASDGLLLIDQHAAHERIVYETLKRSYHSKQMERQSFLMPYELEVSMIDGKILLKRIDSLLELGFELQHFGGSTFLLRSVPSILVDVKWEAFLLDLIPVLKDGGDLTTERVLDKLLTVMACHGAVRAGKRMSQEEITRLINKLEEMDLPTNCPHGRPIFRKLSYYEIEKMFKRVL